MRLAEALETHTLCSQSFGSKGAVQVFARVFPAADGYAQAGWDLHHLTDYVVSSSASGPSLILIPRSDS